MNSEKKKACQDDRLRGIIDFTPTVKPKEKGVTPNIGDEDSSVKLGLRDLMMVFGEMMNTGLPSLARLQREAREGRDG